MSGFFRMIFGGHGEGHGGWYVYENPQRVFL